MVKFLVGFTNGGEKDFMVETMEASFRYPQDYSFYIQNFTTVRYDRIVEPSRQATFEYAFTPSETFNARPFGLTINLNYKDSVSVKICSLSKILEWKDDYDFCMSKDVY